MLCIITILKNLIIFRKTSCWRPFITKAKNCGCPEKSIGKFQRENQWLSLPVNIIASLKNSANLPGKHFITEVVGCKKSVKIDSRENITDFFHIIKAKQVVTKILASVTSFKDNLPVYK